MSFSWVHGLPLRAVRAAVVLVMVSAWIIAVPKPGRAIKLDCGGKVAGDVVLEEDIGPCPGHGLIIAASNVTLDLDGHTISGAPSAAFSAGIVVEGRREVVIKNGTVRDFDVGIIFSGRQNQGTRLSRLTQMHVLNNGSHGIRLSDWAMNNTVAGNTMVGNGIAMFVHETAEGNSVTNNEITQTAAQAVDLHGSRNAFFLNVIRGNHSSAGILGGTENSYRDNRFEGNGQGVVLSGTGNRVQRNVITNNGFDGLFLPGGFLNDGFPDPFGNVVTNNTIQGNAVNGIFAQCTRDPAVTGAPCVSAAQNHQFLNNRVTGNGGASAGFQIFIRGFLVGNFDLLDTNPGDTCDGNVWSGNTFDTAFPACTAAP